MRHREEDSRAASNRVNTYSLGAASLHMGSAIYPGLGGTTFNDGTYEVMDDVTGEFGEQNNCYHYTETNQSFAEIPFTVLWTGASPGTIITGTLCGPSSRSVHSVMSSIAVPHHPSAPYETRWNIPDWSSEGWYNIYPVIKQQVGALNGIYELKDFRALPSLLRRSRGTYDKLLAWFAVNPARRATKAILGIDRWNWVAPDRRYRGEMLLKLQKILKQPVAPVFQRRRPLAEILRDLAGLAPEHFLNWEFAVLPFFSDLSGLYMAGRTVKGQIDKLLEKADGSIQKGHWQKTLPASELGLSDNVLDVDPIYTAQGASTHRYVSSLNDVKYTLSVHYSFTFPGMAREIAHELGYLDSIGVSPSAGNLWRATKYTFIVDWFLRIGPLLDRVSPHLLEPVVNIHGGIHSIKYQLRTVCQLYPWGEYRAEPSYSWYVPGPYIVATQEKDVYVRKMRIPSLLGLPKTSDFSTMEKFLALALGLTHGKTRFTTG